MLQFLAQVEEGDIDGAIEQVITDFFPRTIFFSLISYSFMRFSIPSRLLRHLRNACVRTSGTASVLPHCLLDLDGQTMRV